MSNEELAVQIKEGKTEYCLQLWKQIKLLLYKYLHCFKIKYQSRIAAYGLTDEDLMQELYFAMLEAVKTFDNERQCKFTTYLKYHIFNCLYSAIGLTRKADLLNKCVSLDNLVTGNEEDGTFLDLIIDDSSEEEFRRIEDSIYYSELRTMLESAIDDNLTPAEAKRIREHYFNNKTMQRIAEEECCSNSAISFCINKGIEKLRHSSDAEQIRRYCDIDYYKGNGLNAYKNRGYSIVELAAEIRQKAF